MQSGYIESLHIQRSRGLSFECVSLLELEAGKGIVGDCHALGGEKQIALISSEAKKWIREQELVGLCFYKFQWNIVTQGMDYTLLNEGDILETNDVSIEIAAYTKRCFPECILKRNNQSCKLKWEIKFGKVLKAGKIQVGDKVWQKNKSIFK